MRSAPSAKRSSAGGVRQAQRLETRARLFDAAVAEISRSGLAGADVSAIAAEAGVVRGTFLDRPFDVDALSAQLANETFLATHL